MKKSMILSLCLLSFCSAMSFASSDQDQFNQPIQEQLLDSTFGVYQGHHSGTNGGVCTVEVKLEQGEVSTQVSSTQPLRQYKMGNLVELTGPVSSVPMNKADFLNTVKGSFIDKGDGSFGYSVDESKFRFNINHYLRLQYTGNTLSAVELSYAETIHFQVYGPRASEYSIQCTNLVKIK